MSVDSRAHASPALAASLQAAAMFPLPDRAQIRVTGNDRVKFLQNFCTNDLRLLTDGRGCEAFCCNVKGRVLAHITIFSLGEALWIDSGAGSASALIAHLDRYLIREDVAFADVSNNYAQFAFVGPEASAALQSLLTSRGLDAAKASALDAAPGIATVAWTADAELPVLVRAVDWWPRQIRMLLIPSDWQDDWQQQATDLEIVTGTAADWNSLRIASGWPEYGQDISDANLPQEVARTERCINFKKGCYLGQEPIARLDALGHTNRELRRLHIASADVPAIDTELFAENTTDSAGRLTSAAPAPDGNGCVALGYVKTRWNAAGTRLVVGAPSAPETATEASPVIAVVQ